MILTRRKLIGGMGLLFAAPAIVRAGSLMPVKPLRFETLSAHALQWTTPMPSLMFQVQTSADGVHWITQRDVVATRQENGSLFVPLQFDTGRYMRLKPTVG